MIKRADTPVYIPRDDFGVADMAGFRYVDRLEKQKVLNNTRTTTHQNGWKELVVMLNAIIFWEKKWFPTLTITCVTILYFYAWLMSDCSTLCVIYTVCLYVTLLDCFVYGLFLRTLAPNSWNEDKERTYATFVNTMTDYCATFRLFAERFFEFRQTRNVLFHSVLAAMFITLLYAESRIDTLFKSYVTVLAVILYVAFKTRGEYFGRSLLVYLPF